MHHPRPRIAVVTLYDHHQEKLADVTHPNHATYCRAHGYSYLSHCGRLDLSRAASWSKLLLVSRVLTLFDFVLWVDTDTVFTHYASVEESIIPCLSNGGRILCHAQPSRNGDATPETNPNFGVVLFRNAEKTQEIIFKIYAQFYQADYPWWEQEAVLTLKQWGMPALDVAPLNSFVSYPGEDHRNRCLIYHAYGPCEPVGKEANCQVARKQAAEGL